MNYDLPNTEVTQSGLTADSAPPARIAGMLGPLTADDFDDPRILTLRSQIDTFGKVDALSVLDGDLSGEQSQQVAHMIKTGIFVGAKPHGGHRHDTGWGKDEFPAGWGVELVVTWVTAIIDRPTKFAVIDDGNFSVFGVFRGVQGVVKVRRVWGRAWHIPTAYPQESI
ncbi:MAG: hypothetical protein FWG47_04785 [Propionibacteriaceae bacterium]|nr:hypothetical protein [Propionibacteriaceae bacterium]